jgi:hypothetical protein
MEGNDVKATPLPESNGLGFPLLLGRGGRKGPKRRLQEGNDTRRRRRRSATALGFRPAIPSSPQSTGTPKQTAEHTAKEKPAYSKRGDDPTSFTRTALERCRPFNHRPVLVGRQEAARRRGPHRTQTGLDRAQIWPEDPNRARCGQPPSAEQSVA